MTNQPNQNTISVEALYKLLRDVCKTPNSFKDDKSLRDSLISQGGIAKYENSSLNIQGSSINTLKRISEVVITGGFEALDAQRKEAKRRLENLDKEITQSNKRTRGGLYNRVQELEQRLRLVLQQNYLLTQRLVDTISDLGSVAASNDLSVRERRSQDSVKRILATLNTKQAPSVLTEINTNVINLSNLD